MSSSHDYQIRKLFTDDPRFGCECRAHLAKKTRCHAFVAYVAGYRYVTGASGRVTRCEKNLCELHARAFAARHGLTFPDQLVLPIIEDREGV